MIWHLLAFDGFDGFDMKTDIIRTELRQVAATTAGSFTTLSGLTPELCSKKRDQGS